MKCLHDIDHSFPITELKSNEKLRISLHFEVLEVISQHGVLCES